MAEPIETREAEHGKRMIELRVRFWTDSLADGKGRIRPKHALTRGTVHLKPNAAHGITAKKSRTFNSLGDLGAAIERELVEHGVKLHPSRRMKKLIATD